MNKKSNLPYSQGILILSGSLLLVLSSCTKEVPFKALPAEEKQETYAKALIDTENDYLYSASQQMSSMSSEEAFPFYASDNKRVKIRLTETTMQVIEVERDQRFSSNSNNDKLVLEIPIKHTEFQCAKDNFGECTNKEEATTEVPWEQRKNVKIEAKEIKTGQLELLPLIDYTNDYSGCYQEKASELVYSQVEAEAINFQIKKTFLVMPHCLGNITSLSDATVSAVYHYSLVKANSVLSSDYKTISYPITSKDEQTFGFFSTAKVTRDTDLNITDKSTQQIMNRWNPNRKVINYYLSDEFAKPENKLISDLTFQTVDKLNVGLEESGVNFRINLQQGKGKIPGDIRNSMIVLVEDPVASSVIGYGPQTEDPLTGEIISARTIMFLGTIKTYIKTTYNDIIEAKKVQLAQKSVITEPSQKVTPFALSSALSNKVMTKVQTGKTFGLNLAIEKIEDKKKLAEQEKKLAANQPKTEQKANLKLSVDLNLANNELKNYTKNKNQDYAGRDLATKFKYLQEVKNCAFRPESAGLSTSISQKLMDKFADDAKPWAELSENEKQNVINIILPEIWGVTLIHELGHNLGLRHNFQGSEDKANFFNQEELAAKNIDHEIPFSTVMEYGDDLKASPFLGKYDIAALRFGYKREVDVVSQTDGSIQTLKIPETLEKLALPENTDLKEYGFCTDEHVGINAGCRRFDLGTSYTEIVTNMINDYEKAYDVRNFRNGRESMSLIDDLAYARTIGAIFGNLRTMLEVKERIKYKYGLADGAPEWEKFEFLKDLNTASTLAGQHLAKVIATPDVTCAVVLKEKPTEIMAVLNINDLNPEAMSCFDIQLADKYQIVAQAGKMFNSKKDPNSKNSYADQIDVRGYWIDKVMATNVLLNRKTGVYTFDKNNDSFLNQADVKMPALNLISTIMSNNVVDKVDFKLIDGSKVSIQIPYDLATSQIIDKHMSPRIAKKLGINEEAPTRLQQIVSSTLAREAKDVTGANPQDERLGPAISVFKFSDATTNHNVKDSLRIELGQNTVYVATKQNTFAQDMIKNLRLTRVIEGVDAKTLDAIILAREQNPDAKPAKEATAEEKAIWKIELSTLEEYKDDTLKNSAYYESMIQILPLAF